MNDSTAGRRPYFIANLVIVCTCCVSAQFTGCDTSALNVFNGEGAKINQALKIIDEHQRGKRIKLLKRAAAYLKMNEECIKRLESIHVDSEPPSELRVLMEVLDAEEAALEKGFKELKCSAKKACLDEGISGEIFEKAWFKRQSQNFRRNNSL